MKVLPLLSGMVSTLIMAGEGQPFNTATFENKSNDVSALMADYQWQNRVLLVFAPDAEHGALAEQSANLSGMGADLGARDLVVWQLVDQEPAVVNGAIAPDLASQLFYDHFSIGNGEFTVILLGKDGTEKLKQAQPVTADGLFSLIDAMPMRQREMRERGN